MGFLPCTRVFQLLLVVADEEFVTASSDCDCGLRCLAWNGWGHDNEIEELNIIAEKMFFKMGRSGFLPCAHGHGFCLLLLMWCIGVGAF